MKKKAIKQARKHYIRTLMWCLLKFSVFAFIQADVNAAVEGSSIEASAPRIDVKNAYVRGLPPGQTVTAAFFTLHNRSGKDYVITGITVPFAERAEIHAHLHRDGMMQMRKMESLTIGANSRQEFAPGGYHIMLFGLHRPLRDGEPISLALSFAGGGVLAVEARVRSVLDEKL